MAFLQPNIGEKSDSMCDYCVRTISDTLTVSEEERKSFVEIPHEDNLNNRFPFNDFGRSGCEVFFKGNQQTCNDYLNALPPNIQCFFIVDEVDTDTGKLI